MANVLTVQVAETFTQLLEKEPGLILAKDTLTSFTLNILIQTNPVNIFLDQVYFLSGFEILIEFYYIWVFKFLHA